MECDCAGDADCESTRNRLEACGRHSVRLAARNDTVSRYVKTSKCIQSHGAQKVFCLEDPLCRIPL